MVRLPDFQVHGMMCEERTVHIRGWKAVYQVDLAAQPRVRERPIEAGATPEGFEDRSANLAAYRPWVERHPVLEAPGGVCELVFETGARKDDGELTGTTDLACRGSDGNLLWSVRLYHGWIRE